MCASCCATPFQPSSSTRPRAQRVLAEDRRRAAADQVAGRALGHRGRDLLHPGFGDRVRREHERALGDLRRPVVVRVERLDHEEPGRHAGLGLDRVRRARLSRPRAARAGTPRSPRAARSSCASGSRGRPSSRGRRSAESAARKYADLTSLGACTWRSRPSRPTIRRSPRRRRRSSAPASASSRGQPLFERSVVGGAEGCPSGRRGRCGCPPGSCGRRANWTGAEQRPELEVEARELRGVERVVDLARLRDRLRERAHGVVGEQRVDARRVVELRREPLAPTPRRRAAARRGQARRRTRPPRPRPPRRPERRALRLRRGEEDALEPGAAKRGDEPAGALGGAGPVDDVRPRCERSSRLPAEVGLARRARSAG